MELFNRRCNVSPLILTLIFITFFHNALSRHRIRHHKDRFKRQQGAHLYLPGSYVVEGGEGPDNGPWSDWSEASLCSRTCGGGVSTQYRICAEGYACQGPEKRHFSCNTQDCPDISDYRAQQCAEYNNIPFEGVFYQWVPYTKAPNPCELNCMPRGERFYFRHSPTVVDGTRCNDEKLDVCVNGRCQPVGCDMMLGSSAREDLCRVCGGNGSTCNTIQNTIQMRDMQVGYNDILLIPAGATNIVVEEIGPSNNYLAVRNTSGHYYLNGNWRIDFPRTIEFAGCKFHYERSLQVLSGPDRVTCIGPTYEPLFIVLLYQDSGVPVHYTYSLPTNIVGYESETYAWIYDDFTPCSATCGGGFQYRNVTCAGRRTLEPVDRSLCNTDNEPKSQRKCNEVACEAQWVPQPWGDCSAPCGDGGNQTREVSCQQILGSGYPALADEAECLKHHPKPPNQQRCNVGKICAKWHTGPWKPCDHLCGDGKQTRKVTCYIRNKQKKIEVLADSECEAIEPKPEEAKKCNVRPCEGVDWITSEWSGCERICGLTNETRKVHCATASGKVFPDELCEAEQKPENVRKCQSSNAICEYLWYASQWSECSVKCGEGVQTRTLFCGVVTAHGVQKVDNNKCDVSKNFETIKKCVGEEEECEGEWFSGPWGKCSKPCGGGERTKKVVCLKDEVVVNPSLCGSDKIVFAQEDCNTQPCSDDTIMPTDVTQSIDESEHEKTTLIPEGITEVPESTASTLVSEITKAFEITTEPTTTKPTVSEDEYEIVPDTKCDDGEWVEVEDKTADLKMGENRQTRKVVADTVNDSSFALDDLMLGDAPAATDEATESTIETGSGESPATDSTSSTDVSEITEEEGSGSEPTTEITDLSFGSIPTLPNLITESLDSNITTETAETGITTESLATDLMGSAVTDSSAETESTVSGATEPTDVTEITISAQTGLTTVEGTEPTEVSSEVPPSGTTPSEGTGPTRETTTEIFIGESIVGAKIVTAASATPGITESTTEFTGSTESTTEFTGSTETTTEFTGSTEGTVATTEVSGSTETSAEVTGSTLAEVSGSTPEISGSTVEFTGTTTEFTGSTAEPATTVEGITATTPFPGTTEAATSLSESVTELTEAVTEVSGTTEAVTKVSSVTEGATEVSGITEAVTKASDATEVATEVSGVTEPVTEASGTTVAVTEVSGATEAITEASGATEAVTEVSGSTEAVTELTSATEAVTEVSGATEVVTEVTGTTEAKVTGTTEVLTEVTGTTEGVAEVSGSSQAVTELLGSTEAVTELTGPTQTTTEFIGATEATTEPVGASEIVTEYATSETTDYDIFGSTTETGVTEVTTYGITLFTKTYPLLRMCKRRKVKSCRKTAYGCCWDNITPAEGPFDKGCPTPKTCKESKYGCCEDGVSAALGPKSAGCPSLHCNETLFGCCPDNKTIAEGNNNEGCPPPPPACLKSKYGCCDDNVTKAKGPKQQGCKEEEKPVTEEPTERPEGTTETSTETSTTTEAPEAKEDCKNMTYRCCPDGVTPAEGPGFEGCNLPCSNSTFACCPDGVTPAHGPGGEGCCLSSAFGCCPDNILPARGPNMDGCDCQYSSYGCCPDNSTYAKGYDNEGCGCQHTEHRCCPDSFTPAEGPDYEGCLCHTYQFGCCPDSVTAARGPHQQGCGCRNTEFGCCSDEQTPASGPNNEGCECLSSKFGCCLDGVTEAKGENFEGCDTAPPNLQASCSLPKERGTCRNYTVKWFFDMDYGGCSRFWYGGCDGNGNRFKTKDECDRICVEPVGPEICNLPKVAGPCEGYYPQWFYNSDLNNCVQFIYGGCLGNKNRFETREECMNLCVKDSSVDACEQPKEEGPCKGNYERYYYDKEADQCNKYIYGGCKGNNNNFPTVEACEQKCTAPFRKKVKDTCQLPAETGDCANYVDRWYYDTKEKGCRQFYYGGCGGNGNNFETQQKCEERCEQGKFHPQPTRQPEPLQTAPPTAPVIEPFRPEMCFLPSDVGPCRVSQVRYYYDRGDGVCKSFTYGGCEGNRNNFNSIEECLRNCGAAQDLCVLPPVVGPCSGEYLQYYYEPSNDSCLPFNFGGCGGNYNRFQDQVSCEQRCKKIPSYEVTQAPSAPPSEIAMCYQPSDPGNCTDSNVAFFFDKNTRKCSPFTYTGCGGNDNRFNSEEQCERQCGSFRGQDVCNMERDPGPCRGYFLKYYYDKSTGHCEQFAYGGCQGNGNRFSSNEDCEHICVIHEETKPNITSTAVPEVTEAHPCQEVFDECSTLRCAYGVEAYVDENECNRCQCRDPCRGVECLEDEQCAIDINRNKTSSIDADFIAICRKSNKPGTCPMLEPSLTNCEQECQTDADCTLHLKCCSTGCGTACVDPTPPALLVTQQPEPAYTKKPEETGVQPPKVDQELYKPEVSALIGDQAILNCAVTGNPHPKIRWSKENIEIDGTQPRYRIKLDQSLQIITLHKTDSGIYLCTADNSIGEPITNQIRLDVIVPVRANIMTNDQRYPVGSDIQIPCDVVGYPEPQVQWYKDGVPIHATERLQVSGTNTLSIMRATKDDSGDYQCEAANAYSKVSSTLQLFIEGMYIHPSCKDNQFFANCALIVKAKYCTHKYYAKFCCRSCTEAGLLPVDGPHLAGFNKQNALNTNLV